MWVFFCNKMFILYKTTTSIHFTISQNVNVKKTKIDTEVKFQGK